MRRQARVRSNGALKRSFRAAPIPVGPHRHLTQREVSFRQLIVEIQRFQSSGLRLFVKATFQERSCPGTDRFERRGKAFFRYRRGVLARRGSYIKEELAVREGAVGIRLIGADVSARMASAGIIRASVLNFRMCISSLLEDVL